MITQEELKAICFYNKDTGVFTRRHKVTRYPAGSVMGRLNYVKKGEPYSRWVIDINKRTYKAHNLAWLYVYGSFPSGVIDHINGDSLDNRIDNLRDVDLSCNSRNSKIPKNNKSGRIGISISKDVRFKKYRVASPLGPKSFYTFEEAEAYRIKLEQTNGFHANHGRK